MTVLGAVVFGGILALGVLWLLITAPESDADQAWNGAQWTEDVEPVSASPNAGVLTS
jgi:hypothetical protein